MSKAEGISACDFTFHMAVSRFDQSSEEQLRQIVKRGIASFKIFLAYKNFFGVDDGEMYQTLELAKRLGVIVTAHCENAELVARLQQKLVAEGKTGPQWHEPSRPESVEAEGTGRFATFLENTAATGYVVHLSCDKALHAALGAKARGVKIHVESVLPHFLLDKSYAARPGAEGMKHVMSPPLRAIGSARSSSGRATAAWSIMPRCRWIRSMSMSYIARSRIRRASHRSP
jgi:dihydropyrimidinase